MAETDIKQEVPPKKAGRWPFALGLVMAVAGGGGGFYAIYSGLLFGQPTHDETADAHQEPPAALPETGFVPLDQIVVSLGRNSSAGHLQFRAQLEVPSQHRRDVESLVPRVLDVLNGYLRALEPADVESGDGLERIRAQMLRRVQMVVGETRVNDLLVMEFVLN